MTKIMIVGSWSWPIYEESFSRALTSHGASIYPFSTSKFFQGSIGQKLTAIPIPSFPLFQLNCALVKEAQLVQPDWILFWRPTHILPRTLQKLRLLGFKLASYNNDDPFGPSIHGNVPYHHHYLWSHYLKCLPFFDKNFFYRKVNCHEALSYGAQHSALLLPYFIPWRDKPLALSMEEYSSYKSDIVFVGHYEPDSREKYIFCLD